MGYKSLLRQYGIHPSYIQEMLANSRYNNEDIMAVIEHLKLKRKVLSDVIETARYFYSGQLWYLEAVRCSCRSRCLIFETVLVLFSQALRSRFIRKAKPVVIALNTHGGIDSSLINMRVASHPIRLLADVHTHMHLPQPLITPLSMLPEDVRQELEGKEVLDLGLEIEKDQFSFFPSYCVVPSPLVIGYALAVAVSGKANKIMLAGFDGYSPGDPRNSELERS